MSIYLISFGINTLIAIIAYLLRWLTIGGALCALLLGGITYSFLGFGGWALLLLFFITANILGKIGRVIATKEIEKVQKKGGRRDWAQVMANGSLAGFSALLYHYTKSPVALVMFGSAIASSTADTWAGEAGILSKGDPISIITGKRVPKGMSGGISFLGTASSMLGSLLIAIAWYGAFATYNDIRWFFYASIVAFGGIIGSFADSFLGATVQGLYWDEEYKRISEHESRNGVQFELCRGIRWIDNDVVNFMSNVIAVLFGIGLSLLFLPS